MKNLLKKIRNFKLIRETNGEIVLALLIAGTVLTSIGLITNIITHKPQETTINITITEDPNAIPENSETDGVINILLVIPPEDEPTIEELSTGSPDPTPINKLNEEIVLEINYSEEEFSGNKQSQGEEQGNYSEEELDKASEELSKNFMKYFNTVSDENKKNHSEESESNKFSDIKTEKQLAQNQLPNDKLSIDIYNSIKNIVSENIKDNQLIGDVENISAELAKDIFSRKEGTSNSEENVVNDIKKSLKEKKLLAEKEISEKRKYLKLAQQAKEEYEQRVAVIDRLGVDSVWTQNLIDYKNDKRIIEDLNRKISEAEQFLNNYALRIANETSITVESNESVSENTAAATQPNETIPETNTQPTETTPETTPDTALPSELNLKGTLTNSLGMVSQLTLNINFETQIVSGTISYSGPAPWTVGETDENGDKIPGTEKSIVLQTTVNGTINNGKIDINSKIINADLSTSFSAYWEEKNKTITDSFSTTMLGSLDENNNASGTTATGSVWSAKPY